MSVYDEFYSPNSSTSFDPYKFDFHTYASFDAFDRFMSYVNKLIQEKPEYKTEFPTVYEWVTRYTDKKDKDKEQSKIMFKTDKYETKDMKIDDAKFKNPINNTIPKIPINNTNPAPSPTVNGASISSEVNIPKKCFTETLTKSQFDDITTTGIKADQETSLMKDKIPTYNNFNAGRVSAFDALDSEELNSKVNYILQYFFSRLSSKLDEASKDKATNMIVINLEVPIYKKNEENSYKVTMNVEAHKKAVKMIHNFLTNKGYQKHNINHTIHTENAVFAQGKEVVSPNVTERYTIEIFL